VRRALDCGAPDDPRFAKRRRTGLKRLNMREFLDENVILQNERRPLLADGEQPGRMTLKNAVQNA
jgi:hypothetical protein